MSADPNAPAGGTALWTIGVIQDRPVVGQAGTFVEGKAIEVRFWDGSTTMLTYPKSQYSPDAVRADAQREAEKHLQVKALQGPIVPPDVVAY